MIALARTLRGRQPSQSLLAEFMLDKCVFSAFSNMHNKTMSCVCIGTTPLNIHRQKQCVCISHGSIGNQQQLLRSIGVLLCQAHLVPAMV